MIKSIRFLFGVKEKSRRSNRSNIVINNEYHLFRLKTWWKNVKKVGKKFKVEWDQRRHVAAGTAFRAFLLSQKCPNE
ncbi:MAG: hypothetical protein WBW71_05615 [Bacteroidota bacterium]